MILEFTRGPYTVKLAYKVHLPSAQEPCLTAEFHEGVMQLDGTAVSAKPKVLVDLCNWLPNTGFGSTLGRLCHS